MILVFNFWSLIWAFTWIIFFLIISSACCLQQKNNVTIDGLHLSAKSHIRWWRVFWMSVSVTLRLTTFLESPRKYALPFLGRLPRKTIMFVLPWLLYRPVRVLKSWINAHLLGWTGVVQLCLRCCSSCKRTQTPLHEISWVETQELWAQHGSANLHWPPHCISHIWCPAC